MWMNRELNASDAFVASWLPGSEGAGVADVLFGASEATGRLSFNWPALCNGAPLNSADGALFAFGYGRSFADTEGTPELSEACSLLDGNAAADWYSNGRLAAEISATAGGKDLPNLRGQADGISARGIDRNRQEDAREITFSAGSTLTLSQADTGQGGYRILYSLADLPTQPVTMTVGNEVIDVTAGMAISAGKGWREMVITQACVPTNGDSIAITSAGQLTLQVATIARQEMPEGTKCSF
jgi:beta-glucosidase